MRELQQLFAEAEHFKNKRSNLARNLKNVDEEHRKEMDKLNSLHASKVKNYEAERDAFLSSAKSQAKNQMAAYVQAKNSLQSHVAPIRKWCPKDEIQSYVPNPNTVNEKEINQLVQMIQEQGIWAWIKRTLKIGGYSSRCEMALETCKKIEDACAFCNKKIAEIEDEHNKSEAYKITEIRRKIVAENEQLQTKKQELETKQRANKERALEMIHAFDASVELENMHRKIERMRIDGENACGVWGEYMAPANMPEQVLLGNTRISLPNKNGIEENLELPIWLNLFESNIVVVTSSHGSFSSTDCKEKIFVRKLLARMLKTIPPEYFSYSVFDSLHKGASLERLIDVTNVGTTDINFDLYTSDESDAKTVSCAERRKYLRTRPAEIIKFTAGKTESLFEYNKELGDFEFPFTWYIDFNFPEKPENKFLDDIKELFVNASAAGYSFVFVTNPAGFELINEMAKIYTKTPVLHVDCDAMMYKKGDIKVPFAEKCAPEPEQIYNFMTALKKYYDDGGAIDNRINSVFESRGIAMRDASKKLTIPMALDSRGRLVDLELGGEGSVHGLISGGTNSGKSTLLHTIILSACLHYHPKDLEIWLIDYKQTEFYLYKKKTPPHVKLIGVSKTADFTFSLLDKIEEEANRRTDLMNRFEAQNLEQYRKHENEPGYVNIPRLFIVIDEFHEMSQFVSTEVEYKDKLENILREYRAQGITCLMADQTFSTGLGGLTTAAKNQIGLRIAMRNEASPQEIKDTLEVDRALYSDSMQKTISIMSQGEFIMKVYVRNNNGELKDIRLEKFKGLYSKGDDIIPLSKALRSLYKGQFTKDVLYVNTKEQVAWDDAEPMALDQAEPLRYPHIRLYLGRSATLRPCFGVDLGRQPNENMSIVGGTAFQRFELLASIMRSCKYRQYKLIVFMAEYSDLMSDFGNEIRQMCADVPNAELVERMEDWCRKLKELESVVDARQASEDVVCVFVGLEIATIEFERFRDRSQQTGCGGNSFLNTINKYATPVGGILETAQPISAEPEELFNAMPIIDKLFSSGARSGIRCITEVSVYRQFSKILKIKDMCRHKVAFNMSADDCLMYLGNSNIQKNIGQNAVYGDGGKEVKKLLPYKLQ